MNFTKKIKNECELPLKPPILFGYYFSYFQDISIVFSVSIALLVLNGDNRHRPSTRTGTLTS